MFDRVSITIRRADALAMAGHRIFNFPVA